MAANCFIVLFWLVGFGSVVVIRRRQKETRRLSQSYWFSCSVMEFVILNVEQQLMSCQSMLMVMGLEKGTYSTRNLT